MEALETCRTVTVRSRRRWRGPGIRSAGAGGHGTTQAEPRRPTSGRSDTPEGAAGNPPGPWAEPQQPGAGGEQLGQQAARTGILWRKPCGYGGLAGDPQPAHGHGVDRPGRRAVHVADVAAKQSYAAAKQSRGPALAIFRKSQPAGPPRYRPKPEQPGERAL